METLKQLRKKKEELESQMATRGWYRMGNDNELGKIEEKIKLTEDFVDFIKSLDLDIRIEYKILERLTGEELIGRP